MASLKQCQNIPHSEKAIDFLVYCTRCQSAICLSVKKHDNHAQQAINDDLNAFQQKQWTKYGQMMPRNWIDPFEIYD